MDRQSILTEGRRRWWAVGGAAAAGCLFWVGLCDLDWRWLPASLAVVAALIAMIPVDELRLIIPNGRPVRAGAIAVIAGTCCLSAFGFVAVLSNSPTKVARELASYGPAETLDPKLTNGEVLLDERGRGSGDTSFAAASGYSLYVACDDVSIQLSAGIGRGSTSYGQREVVPCHGTTIAGPLSDRVADGERVHVSVVAPPNVEWHVIATSN